VLLVQRDRLADSDLDDRFSTEGRARIPSIPAGLQPFTGYRCGASHARGRKFETRRAHRPFPQSQVRPFRWIPLQQVVYRQLMYLVVTDSVLVALMGTHLRWHQLARTDEVEVAEPTTP
jgi:hypothetical protein